MSELDKNRARGWYPDPEATEAYQMRKWDGERWTDERQKPASVVWQIVIAVVAIPLIGFLVFGIAVGSRALSGAETADPDAYAQQLSDAVTVHWNEESSVPEVFQESGQAYVGGVQVGDVPAGVALVEFHGVTAEDWCLAVASTEGGNERAVYLAGGASVLDECAIPQASLGDPPVESTRTFTSDHVVSAVDRALPWVSSTSLGTAEEVREALMEPLNRTVIPGACEPVFVRDYGVLHQSAAGDTTPLVIFDAQPGDEAPAVAAVRLEENAAAAKTTLGLVGQVPEECSGGYIATSDNEEYRTTEVISRGFTSDWYGDVVVLEESAENGEGSYITYAMTYANTVIFVSFTSPVGFGADDAARDVLLQVAGALNTEPQ